jgi:hypothetical protein
MLLSQEALAKSDRDRNVRQGTTSVVPQMVNFDSGFSRCGTVNN